MKEVYKKYGLVSVSILVIGAFVYFTFIAQGSPDNELEGFINPEKLDRTPLKQEVYKTKRKREKQMVNYERKVTSLNDYLKNQIDKDPFSEDSIPEAMEVSEMKKSDHRLVEGGAKVANDERIMTRNVRNYNPVKLPTAPKHETDHEGESRRTGFASGGGENLASIKSQNQTGISIPVVVQESAMIETGSTIKLRLTATTVIKALEIPENTLVYGDVSIRSNTIQIKVESIHFEDRLLHVQLLAYDLSGNEGLIIEGGPGKEIKEDVLRETVNDVQDRVNIPILNNSPFRSARRHIRDRAIPIEAGYRLFLRGSQVTVK